MVFLPLDRMGCLERTDVVPPIYTEGPAGSASNELCEFSQVTNFSGLSISFVKRGTWE